MISDCFDCCVFLMLYSVHRGAYTGYCLAAISNDGLAQCSAYSTDAYAVLDLRIAGCLLLVSAAVAVVAVDC